MATIYANARFTHRADTLENWQSKNPVLLKGEPSIVTNGTEGECVKIGDGVTDWNHLPFIRGPKGEKGEKGDTGSKGAKGDKGDTGEISKDYADNFLSAALKGSKEGNGVALCDTSETEHRISLALSGEVSDFSDVSVSVYSQNLLSGKNRKTPLTQRGVTVQYLEDEDVYLLDGTCTATGALSLKTNILPSIQGENYTCTCTYVSGSVSESGTAVFNVCCGDTAADNTTNWISAPLRSGTKTAKLDAKYINATKFYFAAGVEFKQYKLKIQLEAGSLSHGHKAYSEPEVYTPNSDGVIENVRSCYPTTLITASDENLTITARYNRDLTKTIESLEKAIIFSGGNV